MDAREIRREKVKVLVSTRLGRKLVTRINMKDIVKNKGVGIESNTQTFVVVTCIDNWRWQGVPFYYTGKKLPYQCVEVVVKLKSPPIGLFEGEIP